MGVLYCAFLCVCMHVFRDVFLFYKEDYHLENNRMSFGPVVFINASANLLYGWYINKIFSYNMLKGKNLPNTSDVFIEKKRERE